MAAVVVAGRQFDRQVDEAELFVDATSAPTRRRCRCRSTSPVSHVSLPNSPGARNRVEDPQALAGPRVEAADVALSLRLALRHDAAGMRGADDDDVLRDDRRRVQADLAGDRDPSPGRRPSSDRRCRSCRTRGRARRSWRRARSAGSPASRRGSARPGRRSSRRGRGPRAAAAPPRPRLPSFSLCIHSISPVAASSATTARRVPAVEYRRPFTISGVAWRLNSGRGPRRRS